MKLRLFWTILIAFVLVIVLGIVGMLTSFGIAFLLLRPDRDYHDRFVNTRDLYVDTLADYYVARGGSWHGVEQRLRMFPGPPGLDPVIIDMQGHVVASGPDGPVAGVQVSPEWLAKGEPVLVGSQTVGTVVFMYGTPVGMSNSPPAEFLRFLRGVLAAGLGLVVVLTGLAVVVAGRLSRPIRALTDAARRMADGRLDVRVSGAAVYELDELGHAFNRMAEALGDADRQRRQLTADVAHELRTPLAVIKGRLEGLQDGVYEASPEQIERLLDEAALLERLIEDLRLLALAEAGQLPLFPEFCDPLELLEDTAAAFAHQADTQHVHMAVEASGTLPAIWVDPQRVAQVFANLVTNALRHTPAGGTVTLRAHTLAVANTQAQSLVFEVADTGQGIAAEDLPHIFERFWRADRARTRGSGGSGLGLAITRQIVLAHNGTITVASTPGSGTVFSICLPAESPQLLPGIHSASLVRVSGS